MIKNLQWASVSGKKNILEGMVYFGSGDSLISIVWTSGLVRENGISKQKLIVI